MASTTELKELFVLLREHGVTEFKQGDLEVKFAIFGPTPHELNYDQNGNIKKPADHSTLQEMLAGADKMTDEEQEELEMWSSQ